MTSETAKYLLAGIQTAALAELQTERGTISSSLLNSRAALKQQSQATGRQSLQIVTDLHVSACSKAANWDFSDSLMR